MPESEGAPAEGAGAMVAKNSPLKDFRPGPEVTDGAYEGGG